jgi:alpha,alpha-trehalase
MGLLGQSELDSTTLFKNLRAACESGWDFSSRWMNYDATMANIHTTEIVPVDLNCLLYQLERTLAKAYAGKGRKAEAKAMNDASENRGLAIRKYFWFAEEGFFMDYAFWDQYHTGVHSLATVFPLVVKLASEAQAFSVAERLENEFLKEGGLVTTLNESGQQWDFPNGWAPLQWLAVKGLRNYDLNALADDVAYRWIQTVDQTFQRHGKILEKYNVIDPSLHPAGGEYPTQDGFGWTNGVYMGFMAP